MNHTLVHTVALHDGFNFAAPYPHLTACFVHSIFQLSGKLPCHQRASNMLSDGHTLCSVHSGFLEQRKSEDSFMHNTSIRRFVLLLSAQCDGPSLAALVDSMPPELFADMVIANMERLPPRPADDGSGGAGGLASMMQVSIAIAKCITKCSHQ